MLVGEDKFLVVALVMAIIFVGLAVYLVVLDRKLAKLEKRQQEMLSSGKEKNV